MQYTCIMILYVYFCLYQRQWKVKVTVPSKRTTGPTAGKSNIVSLDVAQMTVVRTSFLREYIASSLRSPFVCGIVFNFGYHVSSPSFHHNSNCHNQFLKVHILLVFKTFPSLAC